MGTITPTAYNSATKPIVHGSLVGHRAIIGTGIVDGDIVQIPFSGKVAAFASHNTAVAAGAQLQLDTSTAKQVTLDDAGNADDTLSLLVIEL